MVDTNVLLDASSCIDLAKFYRQHPEVDPASDGATLRRQRARESLLLSIHLNNLGATTFSLYEFLRMAEREVDPKLTNKFENHAMQIWVYYVKDVVLPDWVMLCPENGDNEPTGSR